MNRRGFTLVELVSSVGLISVIIFGACALYIVFLKTDRRTTQQTESSVYSLLVLKELRTKLYMAGGGSLSPWRSVVLENSCSARLWFPNCFNSDRVNIMTAKQTADRTDFVPVLSVNTYDRSLGIVNIPFTGLIPCPLTSAHVNTSIALTTPDTNTVLVLWVTGVDTTLCNLITQDSLQGEIFNTTGATTANYTNGSMSFVTINTYYYDQSGKQIIEFSKVDNSAALDPLDKKVLANDIWDFQVALGYDSGNRDGKIDNRLALDDEVLYNLSGSETMSSINGGLGANPADLRMIFCGVVVALPDSTETNTSNEKVFDGNAINITGHKVFSLTKRFYLRNVAIYN